MEHITASGSAPPRGALGGLVGASAAMQRLYDHIERVAATDAAVLITGESGTGKELVARTVHASSARGGRPFVPVNCGAIAPGLADAELFGHEKGSFTGAAGQRAGYFEHAAGGTLFLDEVSELTAETQVKLLHVLESGAFLRVGGSDEMRVDVRIIAASNRSLPAAVQAGRFRRDLMYRLAVFPIEVPPLRERVGDVELLAGHFVARLNARERACKNLSRRSLEVMRAHAWPGNVRELRNVVQRAYILAGRHIEVTGASLGPRGAARRGDGALSFGVGTPLAEAQREIILATLDHYGGDKRRAARVLGVSLKTLYNRLDLYGGRRRHRPAA